MANKESDNDKINLLKLALTFVVGFAAFSLFGFVILIFLLSFGLLPTM